MYGKFFQSTFTGSMFGAGPVVFAVWGYVIANVWDGTVELNPPLLAAILGTTPAEVNRAIGVLCSPDARSRSQGEEGRRMLHEGGFLYHVVNHEHYRKLRNEEERRAYNREAKQRERAKRGASYGESMTTTASQTCQPRSAQAEAEAEAKPEAQAEAHTVAVDDGFDSFWAAYPKKVGKGAARKAWRKLKPSGDILRAVERQKRSKQWLRESGRYIPNPATWLNQERWDDEPDPDVPYLSDRTIKLLGNDEHVLGAVMTNSDKRPFFDALKRMGFAFSRDDIDAPFASVYFDALRDLEWPNVQAAMRDCVEAMSWFPKPHDIRDAEVGVRAKADEARTKRLLAHLPDGRDMYCHACEDTGVVRGLECPGDGRCNVGHCGHPDYPSTAHTYTRKCQCRATNPVLQQQREFLRTHARTAAVKGER